MLNLKALSISNLLTHNYPISMVEEAVLDCELSLEVVSDQLLELSFQKHMVIPMVDCGLLLFVYYTCLYEGCLLCGTLAACALLWVFTYLQFLYIFCLCAVVGTFLLLALVLGVSVL